MIAGDVEGSIFFWESAEPVTFPFFAPIEAALQQRFCPEGGLRADLLLGTSRSVLHWATSCKSCGVGGLDSQCYAKDGQGISWYFPDCI